MRHTPVPPRAVRVVMLVDNRVIGDSRVIKSARSAAAAGYDVVILGFGPATDFTVGGVSVLLRPGAVRSPAEPQEWALGRRLTRDEKRLAQRRTLAINRAQRRRDRLHRIAADRGTPARSAAQLLGTGIQISSVLTRKLYSARIRARRIAMRDPADIPIVSTFVADSRPDDAGWEALDPFPGRLCGGWADELDRLRPDIIHAHDYRALPAAIEARERAAKAGRRMKVLYDAHEWVQGYEELGPQRHEAAMRIERGYIRRADCAITVDPEIARLIESSYGLTEMPVVLNGPEVPPGPTPGPRLRERIRVAADTPLLVYAGSVGKSRALRMCVEALPLLPGVHLALVVGQPDSSVMLDLGALASDLGVRERLHITRYVPQEYVVDFVSDADIGIIPHRRNPNTERSLPTKAREYLLAGVPQVVSNVHALAAWVRDNGLGEVFEADDSDAFARAVQTVLADPEPYRARITDELRWEHSWAAQAEVLTSVYDRMARRRTGRGRTDTTRAAVPPVTSGVDPAEAELLLPESRASTSLVIGPANSAGQGHAWATAARSLPGVEATNVALDHGAPFGFPADRLISVAERTDQAWVARLDAEVARTRSHVLLESGSTLSGSSLDSFAVAAHVGLLEQAGARVAMVLHGSEIRSPRRHAQIHLGSPFPSADPTWVETLQKRADATRALVEWLGIPLFVSTPDLLDYVPWATWLPVAIDPSAYASDRPVLDNPRPVVLHSPSNAALKGTAVIEPVLQRLHEEGLLTYVQLSGLSHRAAADAVRAADIVIDQLGMGLYGVLSCEAMAAGRVVLAEVGPSIRSRVPGGGPPSIEITAESLETTVRSVVGEGRAQARAAAAQGPHYVDTHHSGASSARVLSTFLAWS